MTASTHPVSPLWEYFALWLGELNGERHDQEICIFLFRGK